MNGNKLTIEEIKEKINIIQPDVELLSDEYTNNRQQLLFKCSCGKNFHKNWSTINSRQSCQCRSCTYKRAWENGERRDTGFEGLYEEEFKSHGFTPLEYIGSIKHKILCSDVNGYRGYISLENARKDKSFSRYSIRFNEDNLLYNLNNFCKLSMNDAQVISYEIADRACDIKIKCLCSCGNEFITNVGNFTTQRKWSCVKCISTKSTLEKRTEIELDRLGIEYICQKRFDKCRSDVSGYLLPFDYYIPKYNMCIEVDGLQHYKPSKFGNETREETIKNFEKRKRYDSIKTEYCIENGMTLIRIPYLAYHRQSNSYKDIIRNLFNQS